MKILAYLKDFRFSFLLALIAALVILDALYGGPNILHLGVEFIGGTQIPVRLEHSVDPGTMSTLITTLQSRLSTFGLKQVTVEGIGNSQVYVIIPSVSPSEINGTISLIQSQGVFQGIVNGKEALNGTSLLSGSLQGSGSQPLISGSNVTWAVNFFITQDAANKFAKVVFGQANKPLYLFLDRPNGAVVLLNASLLKTSGSQFGTNQTAEIKAMQQATSFGNRTIPIEIYSADSGNANSILTFLSANRDKYGEVILTSGTPKSIVDGASSLNYSLRYTSAQNITPSFISSFSGTSQVVAIDAWPAIGLLSAPVLSPDVTNGSTGQQYQITGSAPQGLSLSEKEQFAINQSSKIVSILNGGALPVHVTVEVPTTIPPTLGQRFEFISGIALLIAIIAVSGTVGLRYRKAFLIGPIIFTTLAELFIIGSIIGLIGTIDLAAVAGMIAVIGTGVDAQIIITDEILSKSNEHGMKLRLNDAFFVIWADAALLVIAMMPLMFSTSLVTIIGFAESTILGVLFGAFVTRPAYGAMLTHHYAKPGE
ncbi:Protein-export membrane protein SecD [uncultured archaeon]|nr:Protein-export membrane protein SecD [uncultured archaeon]